MKKRETISLTGEVLAQWVREKTPEYTNKDFGIYGVSYERDRDIIMIFISGPDIEDVVEGQEAHRHHIEG